MVSSPGFDRGFCESNRSVPLSHSKRGRVSRRSRVGATAPEAPATKAGVAISHCGAGAARRSRTKTYGGAQASHKIDSRRQLRSANEVRKNQACQGMRAFVWGNFEGVRAAAVGCSVPWIQFFVSLPLRSTARERSGVLLAQNRWTFPLSRWWQCLNQERLPRARCTNCSPA